MKTSPAEDIPKYRWPGILVLTNMRLLFVPHRSLLEGATRVLFCLSAMAGSSVASLWPSSCQSKYIIPVTTTTSDQEGQQRHHEDQGKGGGGGGGERGERGGGEEEKGNLVGGGIPIGQLYCSVTSHLAQFNDDITTSIETTYYERGGGAAGAAAADGEYFDKLRGRESVGIGSVTSKNVNKSAKLMGQFRLIERFLGTYLEAGSLFHFFTFSLFSLRISSDFIISC